MLDSLGGSALISDRGPPGRVRYRYTKEADEITIEFVLNSIEGFAAE
jgi:hypothetical protein